MATARERAREAALRHPDSKGFRALHDCAESAAGAASDVWEPIVRDLLDLTRRLPGCRDPECSVCAEQKAVIERAKEALDG